MQSEIVQMARQRCIYEVDKIFGEDKKISIIKKTDSTIEFKKGSFWNISLNPKETDLKGSIKFEGNGKTTINIDYERIYLVYFYIVFELIFISLGIFLIALPGLLGIENLSSTIFGVALLILAPMAPIEATYFSIKGGKTFAEDLFLQLKNKSYDEQETD